MARDVRFEIQAIDRFSGQLKKLEGELVEIRTKLDNMGSSGKRAGDEIKTGSQKAGGALSFLRGRFLAVGAVVGTVTFGIMKLKDAVDKFVDTAGRFEYFRTQLANMYGSVEQGNKVFEEFNRVAATTPFTLERVVQAGVTLRAFTGKIFDPQMVKILADLAAYMNRDIVEAASAMGRAFAGGAGAADVFRETGVLTLIKMKTGIQDLTKLSLPEFRKAMFETFLDPKVGIVGATNRLSQTIVGLRSNFEDAMTRISAAIGNKFLPIYKGALKTAIGLANGFLDLIDSQADKIREQRLEFNALIDLLKQTNLHETVRAQIIQTLNDKYKSYLQNLDLEKATLADLERIQRAANEQFERRVKLAIAEKTVQKYQQRIQDLAEELIDAQKDLAKFADYQKILEDRAKRGVYIYDSVFRAVSRRKDVIRKLNDEIRRTYEEMNKEVKQVMELRLALGETSTSTDDLLKKVSKSLVDVSKKTRETILEQVNELRKSPTAEVAQRIVSRFESLKKKLADLMTELVINPQLPQSRIDDIIDKIRQLRETVSAMEPLYVRAKMIVERDTKQPELQQPELQQPDFTIPQIEQLPIEDITKNAFDRLRELSNQMWDEQVQRAMQGAADAAQAWAQGLQAMNDLERMTFENRWEWEKNFRLQQLEEKWNMLTKEQKMLLGGEAYYQKMRLKITKEANRAQMQMMLSTASSAIRGFVSLMQAMTEAGGEQVAAVKVLMGIQALIDAYAAINRAFATLPTPLAIVASIGIGASTMANVMNIRSQNVPRPRIKAKVPNPRVETGSYSTPGANLAMATGGIVQRPIVSADTVPAILTQGEAVISRRVVSQNRPDVERIISGEPPAQQQPVVQLSPVFNINAVDSQGVAEFVQSIEFRDAFADVVNYGLLQLRYNDQLIEVKR